MEKVYFTAMYDVLQNTDLHTLKAIILNKFKAKIVRLRSAQRKGALIDTEEQERMLGKKPPDTTF